MPSKLPFTQYKAVIDPDGTIGLVKDEHGPIVLMSEACHAVDQATRQGMNHVISQIEDMAKEARDQYMASRPADLKLADYGATLFFIASLLRQKGQE